MSPERIGDRRVATGLTHDELSKDLAHLQSKLATKRAAIRRLEHKVQLVELERDKLRTAFNAANNYIHSSQDTGAESQARYTAWIEARNEVTG